MKRSRFDVKCISIRTRLVLYFAVLILVPLAAVSLIVNWQVTNVLSDNLEASANTAVADIRDSLDSLTKNGEATLAWLASNPALTQDKTPQQQAALRAELERYIKSNPDSVEAFVGTVDGKFYIYPEAKIPDGYDPRPREWYAQAAKNPGTMQWSNPFTTKSGKNVVSVSTTLKDAAGQVTGVIAIEFSTQNIAAMIEKTKIGEEGYAVLLDSLGNVISYPPDPAKFGKSMLEGNATTQRLYNADTPKQGSFHFELDGREKLMVYEIMDKTNWRISGTLYNDEINSTLGTIQKMTAAVGVGALLIAIAVSFLVAITISKQLRELEAVMKRAEQGDLTVESVNTYNDEIGRVGRSFNQMLAGLRQIMTEVAMTSHQLAASSDQLMVSADQTAQASEHIARSVEHITTGSFEQTQRVSETSHVISELTEGVQQISVNVQDVSSRASASADQAESGRTFMQSALHSMNEVYEVVSETADSVAVLGGKSQEIGQIVDLITQIAGQTNLLALNAAIEAARAGDAGRGFAVVADEVRKLAEQSAVAAQQITERIHEIQEVTETVVFQVQNGMTGMKRGHDVFQQAGGVFAQIIDEVQSITGQVQSVSAASEQMAVGTGQMVGSVDRIVEIAEGFSSQSQEVNAAVEEQTASMLEIHSSAQELSGMAEKLQELVRKFQL